MDPETARTSRKQKIKPKKISRTALDSGLVVKFVLFFCFFLFSRGFFGFDQK